MKKSDLAKFRKTLATLRVLCPTDYPVRVRRVPMGEGFHGDVCISTRGKKAYKVRINSENCITCQIETLVHEWAHCMTWCVTHERHDDHGSHFGIAYAEAYQAAYD